jgi:hypothetical protein
MLSKKWFDVQLREITIKDLNKLIITDKKNYDILLVWINLSYFNFNIIHYFHSKDTDVPTFLNLANFRSLDLDIMLEELNKWLFTQQDIKPIQKKILKIIEDKHLSKTIYTPLLTNLVDKNIKGFSINKRIPESFYRFYPLEKSYVKEERTIITENKSIKNYIKYLFKTLF